MKTTIQLSTILKSIQISIIPYLKEHCIKFSDLCFIPKETHLYYTSKYIYVYNFILYSLKLFIEQGRLANYWVVKFKYNV